MLIITASKAVDNRVVRSMFRDPRRSINCNPFLLTPNCPCWTWMSAQGITKQPRARETFGSFMFANQRVAPAVLPLTAAGQLVAEEHLKRFLTFCLSAVWVLGRFFICLSTLKRGGEIVVEQLKESPSPDITPLIKGAWWHRFSCFYDSTLLSKCRAGS